MPHKAYGLRLTKVYCPKGCLSGNILSPLTRQSHVGEMLRRKEKRRNLLVSETGYAAAHTRNEEYFLRVRLGIFNKIIHIRTYGIHPALHRRDSKAASGAPYSDAPFGTEFLISYARCTTAMKA